MVLKAEDYLNIWENLKFKGLKESSQLTLL